MKELLTFKKDVFEKIEINQFGNKYVLSNVIQNLKKIKSDLVKIKNDFGNNNSREVILYHKDNLPPKTSRCALEIITFLGNNINHSTNRFENFDTDNIKLLVYLNFKKNDMDQYILKVNVIINFFNELIIRNRTIDEINKKIENWESWIKNYFENHNLKKTKTIQFISSIQRFYKKMELPKTEIKLSHDELIISFSFNSIKSDFIRTQKLNSNKYKNLNDLSLLLLKTEKDISLINAITIDRNSIFTNKKHFFSDKNDFIDFPMYEETIGTIGILDSKIPDNSPFKNLIDVTSYLENKTIHDHGESVSSIALFGDELNGFDDSCGPFKIHLFEVYEDRIDIITIIKRIESAIKTKSHEIKVWNMSLNSTVDEAFVNGKITWFASELDRIQTKYDVVIVQSAGNKDPQLTHKRILSPGDSIKSLVVNATKTLLNNELSNYSLKALGNYFTMKPDVSFWGGSEEFQVNVIKNGRKTTSEGTSYAAPFVARKMAHLIYFEKKTILEAKALLIHSAYLNNYEQSDNGWGTIPNNINDVINSKDNEIKFIINAEIKDTQSAFFDLNIPQKVNQEYSVILTTLCSEDLNYIYGCEYIRSSISISMGPLNKQNDGIDTNRKLKKNEFIEGDESFKNEKLLIKFFDKWKTSMNAKDILSNRRQPKKVDRYGIKAKIDKRMSIISIRKTLNLVCVVTLIHKTNLDKYNKFIELNQKNILYFPSIHQKFKGNVKLTPKNKEDTK